MSTEASGAYKITHLVLFLVCVVTLGCPQTKGKNTIQTSQDNSPSFGDAIVVGSIGDARNLVPILASDSASADICTLVFNGLVKYDKDIKLIGDLAESWEVSQDGLVITFRLRHGVKWHDGMPFTARDVEFTYKKLIDPNVRTPYSGDFERVKQFEVIDDYTVKVTYKEPFSPGLASWGMWMMPRHLLENEDLNTTKFSRSPAGTGPYRFQRWKTAERIELASNKDYFEGRPYIAKYIYRIIPDQATMFLELQGGGVDYTGLTPLQYKRQTDTDYFRKNYQKFRYPSFVYTYLGYNLLDPKFKDRLTRQAIDYAIDKREIIDGVLLGLGRICTGPFPQRSWAYNENVKPVDFDPEKSRELLAQAGWVDTDGDGLLDRDGQKFEFTLMTNQGNEQRQRCAEIIQERLGTVGIKVNLKTVEWSAFINEFVNKKRFEAVILGWQLTPDPDCYDMWHSSKMREGEFNFIGYNNPEVDRLLEEGRRVFDQSRRKEIYGRIHAILYDEQPYTFLYVPDSLPVVHARFKGVEPAPLGINYNFIKWYVPRGLQKYTRIAEEG
jgi:peptide/nickel transport system substrate-binding protein